MERVRRYNPGMDETDDETPRTATLLKDEVSGLIADAFKLGAVLVALFAVIPRGLPLPIHPAIFAVVGALVAAIVIWRIVQFVNAISDQS